MSKVDPAVAKGLNDLFVEYGVSGKVTATKVTKSDREFKSNIVKSVMASASDGKMWMYASSVKVDQSSDLKKIVMDYFPGSTFGSPVQFDARFGQYIINLGSMDKVSIGGVREVLDFLKKAR